MTAKGGAKAKRPVRGKTRTARAAVTRRVRTAMRDPVASARRVAAGEPPADYVEPMKALGTTVLPRGDWTYEIKFDGYRAVATLDARSVGLWSRNRNSLAESYPEIVEALAALRCRRATLDGEIVALDAEGRPRFQLLQGTERSATRPVLRYFLFDLLALDGRSYLAEPIEERRRALAALLRGAPPELLLSPVFTTDPEALLAEVRAKDLEGLVAKAVGSRYEAGRRSGAWVKYRLARDQEFVIGGFTPPRGGRLHFGALLVGYQANGQLHYAGKVGTGFDGRRLAELAARFRPLAQRECPFSDLPLTRRPRFGLGMTAAAMREVVWLRPKLVCQVKFSEWTSDGLLRQPVFLGLREDKAPREVVREIRVPIGR